VELLDARTTIERARSRPLTGMRNFTSFLFPRSFGRARRRGSRASRVFLQ
jgi:hypothetical protein